MGIYYLSAQCFLEHVHCCLTKIEQYLSSLIFFTCSRPFCLNTAYNQIFCFNTGTGCCWWKMPPAIRSFSLTRTLAAAVELRPTDFALSQMFCFNVAVVCCRQMQQACKKSERPLSYPSYSVAANREVRFRKRDYRRVQLNNLKSEVEIGVESGLLLTIFDKMQADCLCVSFKDVQDSQR